MSDNSTPEDQFPNPDILNMEAEEEVPRRILESYAGVIETLKKSKGFTYREIAEWLGERGIVTNHNAVYRIYTKRMTQEEIETEQMHDDIEEEKNR